MNKEQLYPKDIKMLYKKINYIISNEQNQEKISQLVNWIESLNYNFKYICDDNEFLKIYYDNNKYSLQVWKHNINVDSIEFNLISNFYSEYDNEITEIIE